MVIGVLFYYCIKTSRHAMLSNCIAVEFSVVGVYALRASISFLSENSLTRTTLDPFLPYDTRFTNRRGVKLTHLNPKSTYSSLTASKQGFMLTIGSEYHPPLLYLPEKDSIIQLDTA
ncbi:hypothetical protein L6452_06709 [Arctium lappa]|uniref:Uncharacterized protein n=1 Tax=Arctium lappa TaxID=4217 RepID=A0ACB9EJM5_ARCLA|nr:hypothetical protein L6452_06709 [Arctium lappa]